MTITITDVSDDVPSEDLMAVYMRHWRHLRAHLRRSVGSEELADDAMQETWLRLSRMKAHDMGIQDRQAYVLRLAANIAIDLIRKERRHSARCVSDEELLQAIVDSSPSPEVVAVDRDQLRQLAAALAQLPARVCAALLMSRCDGFTHSQIARKLGVSESAVAKYLVAALRHCRDHFRRMA